MDEPSNTTPGGKLRAWRLSQEPKLTLSAAAERVGVKHPTWIDWESGARFPSLEKALAIELLTNGLIPVDAWGFDGAMVVRAADARAARADAPPCELAPDHDSALPATGTGG